MGYVVIAGPKPVLGKREQRRFSKNNAVQRSAAAQRVAGLRVGRMFTAGAGKRPAPTNDSHHRLGQTVARLMPRRARRSASNRQGDQRRVKQPGVTGTVMTFSCPSKAPGEGNRRATGGFLRQRPSSCREAQHSETGEIIADRSRRNAVVAVQYESQTSVNACASALIVDVAGMYVTPVSCGLSIIHRRQ